MTKLQVPSRPGSGGLPVQPIKLPPEQKGSEDGDEENQEIPMLPKLMLDPSSASEMLGWKGDLCATQLCFWALTSHPFGAWILCLMYGSFFFQQSASHIGGPAVLCQQGYPLRSWLVLTASLSPKGGKRVSLSYQVQNAASHSWAWT